MAAPTSNNEVTARRLTRLLTGTDGTGGLWGKIKSMFVQKADKVTSIRPAGSATDDAFPSEKAVREELDSISFEGNATTEDDRLIFEDIIFDSIYPSSGKYGLAVFTEDTAVAATSFAGDAEWLLDWRPYLVDMKTYAGETAKRPVAELQKDNWLRKVDGSYAPACCIQATQMAALDGKKDTLYWKTGSDGDKVSATVPTAFDSSGKFVPAAFWEYVKANLPTVNAKAGVTYAAPVEVKVYVASQAYSYGAYDKYHIPAPWETTDTDLSVFIGRPTDVYLVDGYSATTGEHMRGLTSKPLEVGTNKFDPEAFRLRRTGISPGPATTKGNKVRCLFYNFKGTDSYTSGNAGTATTNIFLNNGTYPRTQVSQYTVANYCRACNTGGSAGNAVPVGEGGYHALNAFLCSLEAAYGTRNLWAATAFSAGVSANYSASEATGGIKVDGTYYTWASSAVTIAGSSTNLSNQVNAYYPKFQCMEPQVAASLATEMGLGANASFKWNGGTWHYEVPTGIGTVRTLGQGAMNCRMYKLTDTKTVNSHTVQCNLVCALAEGVNPTGDIWWYAGGGAELVYLTDGTGNTNYKASFYLEPDQSRWLATSTDEKHTDGSAFPAESAYAKLLDSSTAGGLGNSYTLARTGYTPVRRISGGAVNTGECCYQYRQIDDDAKGTAGIRSRRRLVFRGGATGGYCSPRYLGASYRPSDSSANYGCSAQVLLA